MAQFTLLSSKAKIKIRTEAELLTSNSFVLKHKNNHRDQLTLFFHLHPKRLAYCSLNNSGNKRKKCQLFQDFISFFTSKIIDVRKSARDWNLENADISVNS